MNLLSKDDLIRESFKKFKEHMLALERELKADREFLITQNKRIDILEKKLNECSKQNSIKEEFLAKMNSLNKIEKVSVLEEETELVDSPEQVINDYKIESPQERKGFLATPLRHRSDTSTPFRHAGEIPAPSLNIKNIDVEEIKTRLNKVFYSLTNREFKVFMAIYSLEEQHNSPITYHELAKHMDISASSIRDYLSELSRKGTPVKKEKSRNGIVYISVLPEFRDLNLISKLIAFRNMSSDQKSIFDNF